MATIQTSIKLTDGMTPALKSMQNALHIVINSFENMQKVSGKAVNTKAIQDARSELAKARVSFNNIEKEINENRIAQENFNKSVRGGTSAASGLFGKLKSLAGVYLGFQTVKNAVNASDTFASNTGRLNLITGDLEKTKQLQQEIYEAAQRSRGSYTDMTNAVAKLGITAKNSFSNTDEMVAFTELLNKQFKIAGTSAQEQSAAMYQLTQAMAAGKLQGDEFRSILENAPMLAQSIAKEMGILPDKLKEISSEGKITSNIIKNALFNSANEINEMYSKLPMKFGDLWAQVVNKVNKGLERLYTKLSEVWNNQAVQTFIDGMVNGFLLVANVGIHLFEILSSGFALIYNNWDFIEAILIGVATAYLPTIIGLLWAKVTALWAMIPPLISAAAAWLAINWPVVLVTVAVAGLILLAKHMGVTFGDVCGYICGAFEVLGAVITNIFIGIYNIGSGVVQAIVNAWSWCCDNIGTFFYNIGVQWDNLWIDARVGFYNFINEVLSKLSSLAEKIQPLAELFDVDLSGMIGHAQDSLGTKISNLESGKRQTKAYTAFKEINWKSQDYMSISGAWEKGKIAGANFADKLGTSLSNLSDKLGLNIGDKLTGLDSIGTGAGGSSDPLLNKLAKGVGNIDKNTSTLATAKEDLTYMRDLAEQEAINRYTLTDLKIEMTNNNSINSNMDLDKVVDYLQEKVYEGMLSTANGVHF